MVYTDGLIEGKLNGWFDNFEDRKLFGAYVDINDRLIDLRLYLYFPEFLNLEFFWKRARVLQFIHVD